MSARDIGRMSVVPFLMGAVILDISRGPARGMPSQVRNEDMMEHVRELRDEAEREHVAREADEAHHERRPGRGLRSFLARIFRR